MSNLTKIKSTLIDRDTNSFIEQWEIENSLLDDKHITKNGFEF